MYQCMRIILLNWQTFYSKRTLWSKIMQKKCFLKRNKRFESKKGFPFVSPRSENNKVEAKNLKRKEAKKWTWIFEVNKRNTCETDPISLLFAFKQIIFSSKRAHPMPEHYLILSQCFLMNMYWYFNSCLHNETDIWEKSYVIYNPIFRFSIFEVALLGGYWNCCKILKNLNSNFFWNTSA